MSDTRYPTRMHEVLGVQAEEQFQFEGRTWTVDAHGIASIVQNPNGYEVVGPSVVCEMINHPERIIRRPRLTKEDYIIRLERMRSKKDQWANGKHAHWLETPSDHTKDRDALDAAIEALSGKEGRE